MKHVQFAHEEAQAGDDPLSPEVVAVFGEPQDVNDWPNQATVEDDDPRYLAYVKRAAVRAAKLQRDSLLSDVYDRGVMRVQRELRAAEGDAAEESRLLAELAALDAYAVKLQRVPEQPGFPESIEWPSL